MTGALLSQALELVDAILPACAAIAEGSLISSTVGMGKNADLHLGAVGMVDIPPPVLDTGWGAWGNPAFLEAFARLGGRARLANLLSCGQCDPLVGGLYFVPGGDVRGSWGALGRWPPLPVTCSDLSGQCGPRVEHVG